MPANEMSKSSQGSTKMQQFERYGVIALVFLLVTIVAVSFWGDSKSPGFWSRLTGKNDAKKEQADKLAADKLAQEHFVDGQLPLSNPTLPLPPPSGPVLIDGNMASTADRLPLPTGNEVVATAPGTPPNPFAPGGLQPQGQFQPPVQPIAPTATEYVVQKGDSLASIARKNLGAESRWTEIQAANNGLEPKNLKVGSTILLPAGAAATLAAQPKTSNAVKTSSPEPKKLVANTPKRAVTETKKSTPASVKTAGTYKVKKGDGLRSIARTQLGDESRWKDILAANPGLKADRLQVGDTIKLPGSHASSTSSTGSGPALASASVPTTGDNKPHVR
jgi:LysM repeat protein